VMVVTAHSLDYCSPVTAPSSPAVCYTPTLGPLNWRPSFFTGHAQRWADPIKKLRARPPFAMSSDVEIMWGHDRRMPNLQIPSARAPTYRGRNSLPLPTHGDFKVADSVLAEDYNREEWEAALDKARQRAEPDEDELPLIIVDDFY
jgi:hypothetical protein